MDEGNPGTADDVEQIRELIRQAAAAAEAIGPVFGTLHGDPDGNLPEGA